MRSYNTEKFDFAEIDTVNKSYVICSVPRSGSTLLCRGLWDSSIAGAPKEYFHKQHMEDFYSRWHPKSISEYITYLKRYRTSPNGVFGYKAHFDQFHMLYNEVNIHQTFPNLKYILILRKDHLSQAISLSKATQTKQWSSDDEAQKKPVYDYHDIRLKKELIKTQEVEWEKYFARNKISCLQIYYEEFIQNYQETLLQVLRFLEINVPENIVFSAPKLTKIADSTNDAWFDKYNAEQDTHHNSPQRSVWEPSDFKVESLRIHSDRLPRISVEMGCYNFERYIAEAIESVLAQTLKPYELIISDDQSTDQSWEIIQSYQKKYPDLIRSFRPAENLGMKKCGIMRKNMVRGDLLSTIDGDDRWMPRKLEFEWNALKRNPEAKIAYSNVYIIDDSGKTTDIWHNGTGNAPPCGDVFVQTFAKRFFSTNRNVFRSYLTYYDVLKEIGYKDLHQDLMHPDWDKKIRITSKYTVAYSGQALVEYRNHQGGIHHAKAENLFRSLKYVIRKNYHLLINRSEAEIKYVEENLQSLLLNSASAAGIDPDSIDFSSLKTPSDSKTKLLSTSDESKKPIMTIKNKGSLNSNPVAVRGCGSKRKIAHIINPVLLPEKNNLSFAQSVTFETMRRAKKFAEEFVDLSIFAAHYKEDRDIVPHDFQSTRELDRSVIDLASFQFQRKLPLIADILDRLYRNSDAEYFIYTNIDIALMPEFYITVNEIIENGYDAFIINRRTISDSYSGVDQIPLMYAEIGQSHPGYDCFVFRRDAYKNYRLGNICIGINYVGLALKQNLMCHSNNFKEFLDLHLTFHIGNDKQWKQDKYEDYRRHNESEYRKITAELKTNFNFSMPANSDAEFSGKSKLKADLQFSGVSQSNNSDNNVFNLLKEKNIFFVLSTGRSGTQTIARSLSELPECLCLHEPAPQLITESSAYRYARIDVGKLAQLLAKTRHPVINGKIYGESNQTLSLLVPVLTDVFPDAKFIWLIRNGLDVVASIYSRQWYTGHSANHSRYEDCPPLEKEWIDGRIMGDLCGDVTLAKWKSMDPFARCCWYWAYTNRIIENDLNEFVTINNSKLVRLEQIDRELPGVIDWLGFSAPLKAKPQRHNRAYYKLHSWQKWSKQERQTFLYWCGPIMDRLYPEWRTDHADFFPGNGLAKSNRATNISFSGGFSSKALSAESVPQKTDLPEIHYTPHLSSKPKISVYITSYNQKKYLKEAIDSVLNQTLRPHQVIIVDDSSQDGSQDLIAQYAKKYPELIHPIYHTRNLGVSRTRIDALNSVTGDYVTYVDGDDRFLPNKLELELKTLLDHDDAHIVYSNNCYIDSNGRPQYIWVENERPPQGSIFTETFSREFPKRNLFRMELVNYQAWKSVGFHDPNITIYEDFDMRIRLTRHFRVAYCDEILSEIRLHNHGLSSSKAAQHLASLDYIYQKNRALLIDLKRSEREQTDKLFRSWVNLISKVATDEQSDHNRSKSKSATVSPSARAVSFNSDRGGDQDRQLGSNLIFLISQPRSGSTMLQRILAGHPDIHSTAEPWLMLHPLYALKGSGIQTEYRSILARQGLDDFLMNIPEGPDLYIQALRQMGSVLYNRAIELSGKRFFLDKTPRYYHVIPELYRVYPKAKFIVLFRNPLAVLSSMLKTWFENRPQRLRYPNYIDLLKGPVRLADGIKRLNENAIVVNYETLVQSPVDETRRICNRIGIPFDSHMLEYGNFPKPKGRHGDPVGVYRHNRPVEMYTEKWVENLSSPELSRFARQYLDAMNPKVIANLGYSIEYLKDMLNGRVNPKQVSCAKVQKKLKINQKHDSRYLVSAIVSTYNSEKYIRGCLDDLENQTISDRLEIIVINSGSEQNEDAIVRDYQKRFSNIRYLKTEHRENLYQAWNRGIEMATGKYITNANTDDAHRKDALELLVDAMERHPEAGLAYAHCAWTFEPNCTFADASIYKTVIYPDYNPALSMFFCLLGPHPIWRRTVFQDIGCFDPKYRAAGDYEFQMRFTAAELKAVLVPKVLSLFYQNDQGLTLQSQISQQEVSRIYAKYRANIPISKLYKVDPLSSEDLAEAWTAQGNLATCFQAPWVDHVQVDLSYAYDCYRRALKHKPDFFPAMHNLALIIGLMGKGHVWEQMLKLLPSADQKSLQNVSRDNFRDYLAPVKATQKAGSIAYKPEPSLRVNSTQPSIKWFAPIYDPSGYADEARNFLLNMKSKVSRLTARSIGRQSETFRAQLDITTRQSLDAMLARDGASDSICVIHFPAYAFRRHSKASYHIGRTMFETDELPADWVIKCNEMDEIWVPTDFNLETFRRAGVKAKLVKIPGGIDTQKYRPGYKPLPVQGLRGTVFLSIFEWIYRKGWDVLLRAWSRAFTADDNVSLLLRSYPMNITEGHDAKQEIENRINAFLETELGLERKAVAPIIVLDQQVPEKDMPRLYASAHALVAPSRGEGWGRPQMEAMACGLPVMATRWSGNLEFMHDENSYLIDVDRLSRIDERAEISFYRGQQWAEPSAQHLAELLRCTVDRPAESRSVGRKACQDMQNNWQWSKAATMAAKRLQKIGSSHVQVPQHIPGKRSITLQWEGSQFVYHSLALVNRELCLQLAKHEDLELSLISYEPDQFNPGDGNGRYGPIVKSLNKPLSAPAAVHVRHRWPPDFNPPDQGHWVMIQPWEFGALPADWVDPMEKLVDELWVPSTYVRDVYVNSGISPSKIVVIPNGVNYDNFHPQATPLSLNTSKRFKFLFVGGTLWRKGIDVLLEAYSRAFSSADDVCLVIKDLGGHSFYKGKVADQRIRAFQKNLDFPEVVFITEDLKESQLPGLYTACNCLVHPYRGEGFGLPVAEAMACGLPVVVTRGGACDDFCSPDNAYFLTAHRRPVHMQEMPMVGQGWVLEPDRDELVRILHEIYKDPSASAIKGQKAARDIRDTVDWKQSADLIIERLKVLLSKPILRFQNFNMSTRNTSHHNIAVNN